MDDTLEQPKHSANLNTSGTGDGDHEQDSSGDEDGGLDWTKLPMGNAAARPVILKRGEKDFEPAHGGGSGLQRHNLERARSAMFDALRSTRTISSKSVSYAVWYPDLARAHVTVARGVHFTSMGHSVQRPSLSASGKSLKKRLELLPEEALYLVEKGALFCWKASHDGPGEDMDWDSASQGAPMSVQQAYAEMIGMQDLTLDRYQTFSYLRRLGYIVTRAKPPSPAYPVPAACPASQRSPTASIFPRVLAALWSPVRRFLSWLVQPSTTWWRPLMHRRWLHHNMDYPSVFRTLRFLPAGHSVPLQSRPRKSTADDKPSPYEIFYHLHKPNTPFRKTAPPPPDFSIVVVNARTTPMPTLAELTHMYEGLPVLPPPVPRKRNPTSQKPVVPNPSPPKGHDTISRPSILVRLLSYFPLYSSPPTSGPTPVKINPFMALRQGNKSVVIAVVDAGPVSFFKFGQGTFEDWPMA
ncbi:tRNA-splicing endonuclease subunit sen54 N-term-domain-containing protein [Russula ochroleuca]|uniref:tRNA-splicing endonuclease subunit sen54 N-term-domain-containing protein n=1 Tax=Russula ochroleuca TaxID=152965 RepID=A0A9P5T6C0_9AGAM|nr:tRNA-splicing endonuclease subunit sen54 N-term-domain-containing protein [Russula ochroleuca]